VSGPWVIAFIALTAVVLLLAVLVLGVIRRVMERLLQTEAMFSPKLTDSSSGAGPTPGEPAPSLPSNLVPGSKAPYDTPQGRMVLFLDAGCEPCRVLAHDLTSHGLKLNGFQPILVIDDAALIRQNHFPDGIVVIDDQRSIAKSWQVTGTPSVFLIDETGTVRARSHPNSARDLHQLVMQHSKRDSRRDHKTAFALSSHKPTMEGNSHDH